MALRREELLRILIPPATAVLLTLVYFAVFDRWEKNHDPINSLVVMLLGILGFAVGVGLDAVRRNRRGVRASGAEAPASTD